MNFTNFPKYSLLIFSSFFLYNHAAISEPWIDTSDIHLKAKIQVLSDTGVISTPVTTYPLMWHDIRRDLRKVNQTTLTSIQKSAFEYVSLQGKKAQQSQTRIQAHVSSQAQRFTTFGDQPREKATLSLHSSVSTENYAVKIAPSYVYNPLDGDEFRLDESYAAFFLGNWVISAGKQNRWFGPTWDTSFSLTNNARPIPAIAISRKSAEPVTIPFTEWHIPWTVTTYMGKMDDERTIEDTLLWGFRLNFKPFESLEVGLTRLAQWGGEGKSQSLSTFWDVLIGRTNCGVDGLVCDTAASNPANQQAGYDIRYSFNLFDIPMNITWQEFAEDGNADPGKFITKAQPQYGFDMHVNIFNNPSTVFLEFSDSFADCGFSDDGLSYLDNINTIGEIGDCYYEHHTYTTGMRYNLRTIGSTYDNDAKTYVIGAISQLSNRTRVTTKIRYLDLNRDNSDKGVDNPTIGNPVTSVAEQVWMISGRLEHDYKDWSFTLAANASRSNYPGNDESSKDNADIQGSFTVEYYL